MNRKIIIALIIVAAASVAPAATAAEIIPWTSDMDAGLARAKSENKPVMIDFVADWCGPCKSMDASTFSDAAVVQKAKAFIPVRIDIDKQEAIAAKYNGLARAYGGPGIPNILFLSGNGTKLKQTIGFKTAKQLLSEMDAVLKPKK
jgi:thiol:disulfide interchange protein